MTQFNYYMPSRILFGKGKLNEFINYLPGKKALIVTSAGPSMRKYGYLGRVEELLTKANVPYVIFDKILPNPIKVHIMEGAALAKKNNCDFVIGLGGGSSIDASKSIAVMTTNPGDYWDYISGGSGKGLPVPHAPLPIVAITTTAGTGTEADPWTVVTKEETNEKIGFGYAGTFPTLSVVDPDLMMSVPSHLTAYQGFDALFHATEGYIANIATPVSDMYALKSIELIGKYLATAVNDGSNEEARAMVALANTLSGFVESTSSCISEHSLEHALSAHHPELAHGAGLIMISKEYYTFFAEKGTEKMVDMAKALGVKEAKEPMDFVRALVDLQKSCHVADLKMSDYNVDKDNFEKYAENARHTMGGLFNFDPSPISPEDAAGILARSYN
ncbi:iron-containing alcohol dehydrogenase [Cellulosilyticum sp. I15G10I2]|uniref:iron-containing alcohol dehydrogenase n=1 Tax=Cellulosilyticum sp. I15G10I2 TaxID=1892843 RepID=UPI00085C267B|nr:iron-containing alcohol dehydrogenase [Cellulosilyticum sp. I15G10I2]